MDGMNEWMNKSIKGPKSTERNSNERKYFALKI
jgi:hypothetical protein